MAEILLYGIIGDPIDKLDAATVTTLIRTSSGPLSVRINSPGGYVMEGLAIIEALRSYADPVTIYIDGLAASMASAIAMVGSETIMAESALMMIHKPWDASIGNADELRKDAAKLDKVEEQLIGIYARRTGLSASKIAAMLAAETWFTAEEALAAGFVTSVAAPLKLAAMADVSDCGFRNTPSQLKDRAMPPENVDTTQAAAAERTRITTIQALCSRHALPSTLAGTLIQDNVSLELAREKILDELATRSNAQLIGHNGPMRTNGETLDNPAFHGKAVADAIYARLSGKAPEGAARELMGVSLIDMARDVLFRKGARDVLRMTANDVLNMTARAAYSGAGHTTDDFPDLLKNGGERYLIDQYQAAASVLKQVSRQRSAKDFRAIVGVQTGNFGILDTVNEAGEFKNKSLTTRKESYSITTMGNIVAFTRQAMINDDLGAFADILGMLARAAAETEAAQLAALLISNPLLGDGTALFHADHNNLATSGGAPAVETLNAARIALRSQKDMDGVTPVGGAPKFILGGANVETSIEVVLTALSATQTADVNPFAGKLTPLIDPRLPGNAWYLFADPAAAAVLEYAYLNGGESPFLDSQEGWRVDGVEYKVRHDFGAGAVGFHGAYKNPGA